MAIDVLYQTLFQNKLKHENISVELNHNAMKLSKIIWYAIFAM